MRDAVTTAMEVAGMILISVAAALVLGVAWLGFALSGVALVAVGVLEGRK
jgi:hypothetical protein